MAALLPFRTAADSGIHTLLHTHFTHKWNVGRLLRSNAAPLTESVALSRATFVVWRMLIKIEGCLKLPQWSHCTCILTSRRAPILYCYFYFLGALYSVVSRPYWKVTVIYLSLFACSPLHVFIIQSILKTVRDILVNMHSKKVLLFQA